MINGEAKGQFDFQLNMKCVSSDVRRCVGNYIVENLNDRVNFIRHLNSRAIGYSIGWAGIYNCAYSPY